VAASIVVRPFNSAGFAPVPERVAAGTVIVTVPADVGDQPIGVVPGRSAGEEQAEGEVASDFVQAAGVAGWTVRVGEEGEAEGGEPVVRPVDERGGAEDAQHRHPVGAVRCPDPPPLSGVAVTGVQRTRLEALGDPPAHPGDPVRGGGLREPDHLLRVRGPSVRVIQVCAGVDDRPGVGGADPSRALSPPHLRELRHDRGRLAHAVLDRPVTDSQRGCELCRDRPPRQLHRLRCG